MTLSRLTAWTLLIVAGFALLSTRSVFAQDTPVPQRDRTADSVLNRYKEKETRGIPKGELETAKKHFEAFANYHAAVIAHPLVYKAAQDPSIKFDSEKRTIPTIDTILGEFNRYIQEPTLANRDFVNADRADYIREMGIAVDAALKPVIETHADRIVRVNAARLLAIACKSGATAFYPTVTELLNNANTPPEVKHYLLQAAGNLLSAYDLFEYGTRKHSNAWKQPQSEADKELGALVAAVEKCVTDPAAILGAVPKGAMGLTPDQEDVVRYIRRQAVKALGQVRFVTVPAPDGKTTLYPAYTLARVCMTDPALFPTAGLAPSPAEYAEAVIGLCNMAPVVNGAPVKGYNDAAVCEAITAGLINFSRARTENPTLLPWRGYGLRLGEAFRKWAPLFDPNFNALKPNTFSPPPPAVSDLIKTAQSALLTPLDKVGSDGKPDLVGGRVELEKLSDYLKQLQGSKTRNPLVFTTDKSTALPTIGKQ